jgi:DNA-binding transcriptional LysR family regulator
LPEYLARPLIDSGRLVEKQMQRPNRPIPMSYAWRRASPGNTEGRALTWWLQQLGNPLTRKALLERAQSI